jgi:heptosyltransferase-1
VASAEHSPERILIVLLGAIGDVVRAMPLAMRLRRGFPRARIAWAVEPPAAPLLERHPAIDERLIFRRDRGAPEFVRFLAAVRRLGFDLSLDLQRHLKSGVVSRASGAKVRIGFHRSNSKEVNWIFNSQTIPPQPHWSSKLRQYLAFADHLGLAESPIEFGLSLARQEVERVDGLLRDVRARFGLGAVVVGAAGREAEFAAEVQRAASSDVANLAGQTTLRDLIGIFARSRIAFGPDSGPMHMAAALGTPVVSLWGATSPLRSAPYGAEDLVLVGPVACHPCYLRRCPVGRLCMQEINVEPVLAAIEAGLARRAA